jgi:hypothetical protein
MDVAGARSRGDVDREDGTALSTRGTGPNGFSHSMQPDPQPRAKNGEQGAQERLVGPVRWREELDQREPDV